jgi:hypothetical protein
MARCEREPTRACEADLERLPASREQQLEWRVEAALRRHDRAAVSERLAVLRNVDPADPRIPEFAAALDELAPPVDPARR